MGAGHTTGPRMSFRTNTRSRTSRRDLREGRDYVFVNGTVVIDAGCATGGLAGQVLRRHGHGGAMSR